jgi:hypothetical protein
MEDSLILLVTTCLSRQETDSHLKNFSLTKRQEQSNLRELRVMLGQSLVKEEATILLYHPQILHGTNFSNGMNHQDHSSMLRTTRFLMLLEEKMLRLQMSMLRRRMGLQLKNGKSFTHLI